MEKNRAWTTPPEAWILLQALVLLVTVLSTGCRESPRFVKEGALFAVPEKASPGKAQVYVYWPREEQGQRDRLWVGPCEGMIEEILPGGYITLDAEPGPSCFKVGARSELLGTGDGLASATIVQELGSVELTTKPGRAAFIRLEQRRLPLISRINPRPVEPAVAGPEIRKCRRTVPLTAEELEQQFLQEMERRRQDS